MLDITRFSVECFLSHSTEKFLRGTFLCFNNFLVSKNFMGKRGREGEGVLSFSITYFCLTLPKNFVKEPFCVSEKVLVSKHFVDKTGGDGGGSITILYHKFLSHGADNFRTVTFLFFRKFPLSKNFMPENHDFLSKFCCLTVPKNFVGERFCGSERFSYQTFLCLRGEYHVFL